MTTDQPRSLNTFATSAHPVVLGGTSSPRATRRVLHLINGEHFSGAERVQDLLARQLPQLGFQVDFACVKPDKFPQQYTARASQVHLTPMRSRWDLQTLKQLRAIVRDGDYEILHAHTPRTAMLASVLSKWTGRPFVYHVHSPTSRDSTRPLQNFLNRWIERVSLLGVDKLITVSHSLAAHMRADGFRDEQIQVVPNGVPAATKTRSDQPPTGTWTLGTVALIRPRKGMEVLLEAVSLLRREEWPITLRAVGPFETVDYGCGLKRLVDELGLNDAVEWTGFCSDVDAQLATMDLFVLPSLFGEGLPMVVLEAMAAGVPVVGTLVEGVPEAVRDGQDGVLAMPRDAQDLARAMRGILRGEVDWQQLRRNAQARHAQLFSDRAMAEGCAAVYRDLLPPDDGK